MNKLSKRLGVISSFIEDSSKVIDIGCDHGLLSIYLVNKYKKIYRQKSMITTYINYFRIIFNKTRYNS